jgi:hypothetical protein
MSTRALVLSFVVACSLAGAALADNGQSASPPEKDVAAHPVAGEAAALVVPDRKRAGSTPGVATGSVFTAEPDTGEIRRRYQPSKDGEGPPR